MKMFIGTQLIGMLLLMISAGSAQAGIVTENLNAQFGAAHGITAGEVGQSFTTGSSGPQYNAIFISVYTDPGTSATTPVAEGSLFLLDQEYLGSAADLSSSTLGYIAENQSVSSGSWVFDNAVVLNSNTQYWFYTQGYTSTIPAIGFAGGGGPYAGGINYSGGNAGGMSPTDVFISSDVVDLGFTVIGTSVPEPSTFTLFALAGAALFIRSKN